MKKFLLSIGLTLSMTSAWAIKAWNMPITVTQDDGTEITVFIHGDEDFCWYTSLDGTILNRIGNNFSPITESKESFFRKAENIRKANVMKREAVSGSSQTLFPHTGSPKVLVILAEYADKGFSISNPKKSFDQYLNKQEGAQENFGYHEHRNVSSVRQYFEAMSNGKFSPQFDIYGPVKLPNNMNYYGGTNNTGTDERSAELLTDACELIKDSLDFSQYDSNNDGYIDLIYVIYAGYGQSMGASTETIWPKTSYINNDKTYNGKKIFRYGVNNELLGTESSFNGQPYITGIGIFVHEFSHCLGLPDFYTTKLKGTYDNQGMEDWSVMDAGCYLHNSWNPTAYTAWEREALGWDSIPTISEPQQLAMNDIDNGGKAYRIANNNNPSDYLIIQRIQNKGWNAYITPSGTDVDGLLVYHVDYNENDFAISQNNVNNIAGHPRMTVVPADSLLMSSYRVNNQEITKNDYQNQISGDLYGDGAPTKKTMFEQSAAIPNSQWWATNGTEAVDKINLYNIHSADDGLLYVDFKQEIATAGINNIDAFVSNKTIYNINGTKINCLPSSLPKGIYIIGGKKVVK